MKHALQKFEDQLRRAAAPPPPRLSDWKGTKWNKGRRRLALESALEDWQRSGRGRRGLTQEQRDKRELGAFHSWIVQARAEASAVQKAAKFQTFSRTSKNGIPSIRPGRKRRL